MAVAEAAPGVADLDGAGAGLVGSIAAKKESLNDIQELILSCNKDGMEALRKAKSARHDPQLKAAFEQFKYAEAILLANQTEPHDNTALLAVTCNNLGCYYKKVGKYHGALSYLRRALKMEVELQADEVTLASTHLNICAILSKLEKPDKAVQHALSALELMSKRVTQSDQGVSQDDYAVLAIAYNSVAMEKENSQQWDQAALAFQAGFQVANRLLGEDHPLSITLGKNCEAVLNKAKSTHAKDKPGRTDSKTSHEGDRGEDGLSLPPVPGAMSKEGKSKARSEAIDWVKGEEALWLNFASRALGRSAPTETMEATMSITVAKDSASREDDRSSADDADTGAELVVVKPSLPQPRKPESLAALALAEMQQDMPLPVPQAYDMGKFRFESLSPRQIVKKTPLGKMLDTHPEALMDIMEADNGGAGESKLQDFRPNRTVKRQTRTSRVVRRTGVFNSMTHRDRVEADLAKNRVSQTAPWKSVQKQAAERIQRVWRAWYQYCQANGEWMTITWICATMIQSTWRSYHVRRQRLDRHAQQVQRRIRGFLVRSVLRKHVAAVTIQRHVVGMLTRMKLNRLHVSATTIQRLVRGGLARRRFVEIKTFTCAIVLAIQRHVRVWLAKRVMKKFMQEKTEKKLKLKAVIDLQRLFRGFKGRGKVQARRKEYEEKKREYSAANLLQNVYRGRIARRQVDGLREARLKEMDIASTFLRKVWMGSRTRMKYRLLREEFKKAEDSIVTIQRYMRGCLCRLRMWREAVMAEEELWAVIEIQRVWRGYCGRVIWEKRYEAGWRREMASVVLQQHIRGWLVRVKVKRLRRRAAREQFELSRARFRAAQRIQALVRGVLSRNQTSVRLARYTPAATQIQKIQRGNAVRKKLWQQVIAQRATIMTAGARGFLVRKRRAALLAKAIRIQNAYRRWRERKPQEREVFRQRKRNRHFKAIAIQRHYRQFAERKTLQRIYGAGTSGEE